LKETAVRDASDARKARFLAAVAFGAATFSIVACGGKPPEVSAVEWRLETRPSERGSPFESLSVFGSIKDEDGLDNIEEIWIVHDESSFAWKLTSAEWTKAEEGTDNWIGGSSLATPELGPLPRGKYRLVAIDAAGQKAESPFELAGDFPNKTAPSLSYSSKEGSLSVRSDWTETLALAFDAAGSLLSTVAAPTNTTTLAELFGDDIVDRIALVGTYGYEPELKMGAFSPRVKTR
jgi:hypothetical protein